jgi:hypothetical protein
MFFQLLHDFQVGLPLNPLGSHRRSGHHMRREVIWRQRRIKVAVVIPVIAAGGTAPAAEGTVERAAPVGFPHPGDVKFRIIDPIKIEMRVADIVDDVRIAIK